MKREIILKIEKKLNEEIKKQYDNKSIYCRISSGGEEISSAGREHDGERLNIDVIIKENKNLIKMISAQVFINKNINLSNPLDQEKITKITLNQIYTGIKERWKINPKLEIKQEGEKSGKK